MKKKDEQEAAKQASKQSAVMASALLFLAVVLSRSAVLQFRLGRTISGCISIVGAVVFLGVSLMMFNDLRKDRVNQNKTRKE